MTNTSMNGRKLFIDTGAFIAIAVESDINHEKASRFLRESASRKVQITTNLVIAEAYTFLRYKLGHAVAFGFLDKIRKAERTGYLQIVYSTPALETLAYEFLRRFKDQDLSYVDAVSFAVLKSYEDILDVFTFDSHFYLVRKNLIP